MSNFPDDDDRLILFLRQHRPAVPPASPDVEERIVLCASSRSRHTQTRQLWVVPPALAAGLLISWVGYRVSTPPPASPDTARIEAFLVNNWDVVAGNPPVTQPDSGVEADWQLLGSK